MIKKHVKYSLIICCLICVCTALCITNKKVVNAYTNVEFCVAEITDEYELNSELIIPDCSLTYNSNSYQVDKVELVLPNGQIFTKRNYILNQIGSYTLNLYAKVDETTTLKATKTFKVLNSVYSVSSNKSSYLYEENVNFDLKNKYTDDLISHNFTGIYAKIYDGDTFNYNKVINLQNGLNNIVSFHHYSFNTMKTGEDTYNDGSLYQLENIIFRLTDVNDPENYIEYLIYLHKTSMVYYRASANNQKSVGLSVLNGSTTDKVVYIDNKAYRVFVSQYGSTSNHRGYNDAIRSETPYNILFDASTNSCYIKDSTGTYLVNQLSNPDIQDEVFKGFSTNEVYLSVRGTQFADTPYFELRMTNIGGISGVGLNDDLVDDNNAPIIKINCPDLTNITIAKGEEFKIFDAIGYDANTNHKVTAKVYYNYGTANQTLVTIKDNKFIPNKLGVYTIEYTAKDYFGHIATKTLDLNVVNCQDNKIIYFKTENPETILAGNEVDCSNYNIVGYNGNVTVETYYKFNDKLVKFDNTFIPFELGEYEIIYKYYDLVASYEYSYKVQCIPSNGIIVLGSPVLPKYFIKNGKYSLDRYKVAKYEDRELISCETKIFVSEDNGSYKEIDYNLYEVKANNTLKFKYEFEDYSCETEEKQIIDVGYLDSLDMAKYFQGNVTAEKSYDSITFASNVNTGDVSFDFINPILVNEFNFKFAIPVDCANFSELVIKLVDMKDYNNFVTINYKKDGANGYMSINGGEYVNLSNTQFAGRTRTLTYDKKKHAIIESDSKLAFALPEKFTTERVLTTFTIKGISGNASIQVIEMLNQVISRTSRDNIKSLYTLSNMKNGIKTINTQMTINPLVVVDVLSPVTNNNVLLTVKNPNGEYVTATNGTLLNGVSGLIDSYTINLDKYGTYKYTYVITDGYGIECYTEEYELNVTDNIKPVVTIDGNKELYNVRTKYNSNYKIANCSAVDNNTPSNKLVFVKMALSPTGEMILIQNDTIRLDRKGVWKIYYYCYDDNGNATTVSYKVIAE